jgi:hypothetical protein
MKSARRAASQPGSLAAARTSALDGGPDAQIAGYELGFVVAAAIASAEALVVGIRAWRNAPVRRGSMMSVD